MDNSINWNEIIIVEIAIKGLIRKTCFSENWWNRPKYKAPNKKELQNILVRAFGDCENNTIRTSQIHHNINIALNGVWYNWLLLNYLGANSRSIFGINIFIGPIKQYNFVSNPGGNNHLNINGRIRHNTPKPSLLL